MSFEDCKVVLYRNQPDGWVAEIRAKPGCYTLMPAREPALAELADVFEMIRAEYREAGRPLPADTTELVNAWRRGGRIPPCRGQISLQHIRQVGSHERWSHADGRAVTIPRHGGRDIGAPLFFRILRQLGIDRKQFDELR